MKLITNKQQKEIDESNIKKILYAMSLVYKEHHNHEKEDLLINYLPKAKKEEYKLIAEDIYYADKIML